MIISRAPVRISMGGGGTDLPSYYQKFGGFLLAASINRYVHILLNKRFEELNVEVSMVVPDAGVYNPKEVRGGIPRFKVIALGPLVALIESFATAFLKAQTSHCPTSESPTATPRPASILSI